MKRTFALLLIAVMLLCSMSSVAAIAEEKTTFTIRDAVYSDGVAIKAGDFVFMMKSYLDPANGATLGEDYSNCNIVGAAEFYAGTLTDFEQVGVKALDDKTLQITLSAPNPNLIRDMATNIFSPLREDILAKYGNAMGSTPDQMVYSGS